MYYILLIVVSTFVGLALFCWWIGDGDDDERFSKDAEAMVKIQMGSFVATLRGRHWTCEDYLLARMLNDGMMLYRNISTADPFPQLTIANDIVRRYGGEIIQQESPVHAERQMA